jgi:uncharacterized protein
MRPRRSLNVFALLAVPLVLASCGGEVEPAEAEPATPAANEGEPFAGIPPEELYGADPVENLWSPRVELEAIGLPAGWAGAEIAIISDLRLGGWRGNEEVAAAAVERAVEAGPDLVVLLGDYLTDGTDTAPLQRVLAPLRNVPALAVLGDRDIRSDSIAAQIASALASAGVQVLRNRAVPLVMNGDTAWIAGADPELLDETAADQEYVLATLGVPGRTPILLTHAPGLAARAPEGRYPIVLAADTFCGDVDVPGSGRLSRLRETVFPDAAVEGIERLFHLDGSTMLVTCGVGYGFVPLRFGAAPEVPVLTLASFGEEAAPVDTTGVVPDSLIQEFQGETAPADSL